MPTTREAPSEPGGSPGRLPNFLLIGAEKCGTTSFYEYLRQHPDVFMPDLKGPMFFLLRDGSWVRDYVATNGAVTEGVWTLDEYRRMFEPARGQSAVGEATTFYIAVPKVAQGIKDVLGAPKLLAILRHPADRAFSNYQMYRRFGLEPLETFEEAVEAESWRAASGWPLAYQYLRLGCFGQQLRAYSETLGEASVRLYWFDDLSRDARRVVTDAYRYLGVDPSVPIDTTSHYTTAEQQRWLPLHRAGQTRVGTAVRKVVPRPVLRAVRGVTMEKPRMSPRTRDRLIEFFRDDIRELEKLSGRDLSSWLR